MSKQGVFLIFKSLKIFCQIEEENSNNPRTKRKKIELKIHAQGPRKVNKRLIKAV